MTQYNPGGGNPFLLKGSQEQYDQEWDAGMQDRMRRSGFGNTAGALLTEGDRARDTERRARAWYDRGSAAADRYQGQYDDLLRDISGLPRAAGKNGRPAIGGGPNEGVAQLRQGLESNISGQRALAAGASPSTGAAGARMALRNVADARAGQGGQESLLNMQQHENMLRQRSQALRDQGGFLGRQRALDAQSGLASRGQALQGYGAYEDAAYGRYANEREADGRAIDDGLGALGGFVGAATSIFSDRRAKNKIKDARGDADELLKSLKAYKFSYKDEKNGKGEQFGIMAQDLEKTAAGRGSVIQTAKGKMVDTRKLTTALAAAASRLDERLAKLEKRNA